MTSVAMLNLVRSPTDCDAYGSSERACSFHSMQSNQSVLLGHLPDAVVGVVIKNRIEQAFELFPIWMPKVPTRAWDTKIRTWDDVCAEENVIRSSAQKF